MRIRLIYLSKLYITLLLLFVIQKPMFMYADTPAEAEYSIKDYLSVMSHGLLLDIPMTGYLIAIPFFAIIISSWLKYETRLRKWISWYYGIVAVTICSLFIADTSLYPFWKFKLDATIFYYIDSPKNAFASVSFPYLLIRGAVSITIMALTFLCLRKVTPVTLKPINTLREKAIFTALLLIITVPLAISIRGGLGESTANIGKVYFSKDEYLNHSAVNPCFSLIYSLNKAKDYAEEFNYFEEPERAAIFNGLYPATTDSDTTSLLTTTRPNILIILLESFGGKTVGAVGGRQDITPHYNKLAEEGIIFTKCYSNSFRTDRGMVAALSGYPAFPTLSVMKLPVKSRTLPCIASSLNAEGYRSSFLYGGDINFTNMQSYLRTGGYSDIVSDVDFSASEKAENPWGANDDITFGRLYDIISRQKREPWHIGFLTLSSHEPFEVPYHRLSEQIPNAFAFTDECLRLFVERIRKTPLWKNLLIVCIPDHGFQYPADINHEQHHHNTMLWTGGAVRSHKVIDTIMNQSDMAATLLGQLRINHDRYTFSRDIFSPAYRYPFAFFTFKEGIGFADSTGCTVYDIIGERIFEDEPQPDDTDAAKSTESRITKAKAILQTIYDDLGSR